MKCIGFVHFHEDCKLKVFKTIIDVTFQKKSWILASIPNDALYNQKKGKKLDSKAANKGKR